MTRTEIEAMPGAEVDAYIASKVFGMTWTPVPDCGERRWGRWSDKDGREFEVGYHDSQTWSPSESLDDAMQAAEKVGLEIDGRLFALTYCWKSFDSRKQKEWEGEWVACWMDGDIGEGFPTGRAPTPALAVCRAVIAANEARQ